MFETGDGSDNTRSYAIRDTVFQNGDLSWSSWNKTLAIYTKIIFPENLGYIKTMQKMFFVFTGKTKLGF